MVERTSQPLQLASGNLGQFGGYRPGQARAEQVQEESSLGMQALSGLLKIGGQVAEQAFNTSVKESYMQGQRARMLGKSLEDEDADVLAKPFVRGGYQDQDYRIKQAELQQKMTAFIAGKGRTLPPEQFVAELARESSAVLESMGDGLSNVGREQALMAQTQLEETLIGAHSKANRAYGIEQLGLRVTTEGNAIAAQIAQAKALGDDELLSEAAARAALHIENVRNTLPDEDMRNEVTLGFVEHLLSNDNREVVQGLLASGQLDVLPGAKRAKINSWIEASKARTLAKDSVASAEQEAFFAQRLASRLPGYKGAPVGGAVSREEMDAWSAQAAASGMYNDNEIRARWIDWMKGTSDGEQTSGIVNAFLAGDRQRLYELGVSVQDGASAFLKLGAERRTPLSQMIPAALGYSIKLGTIPKEASTEFASGIRALLINPEAANPEQLGVVSSMIDTITAASRTKPAAASTLIGALDRDLQPIVSRMLVDQRAGIPPLESLQNAAAKREAWANLTQEERTAQTKKIQAAVKERLTPGFFKQAWAAINPMDTRVDPNSPEFGRAAEAVAQQALALSYQPDYAGYEPEVLAQMAESMVAARTVTLSPEGANRTQFIVPEAAMAVYGLGDSETNRRFSEAMVELYGQSKGGAKASFLSQAGVIKVQYTVDGVPGPAQPVDPEKIKARIAEKVKDAEESQLKVVRGYDYQIGDGAAIRVNGDNSAGISRAATVSFREQLLRDESVKLTAYPDKTADGTLVGVAVGAGQNVTGKLKPGDKITPAEAELWFHESTDAALNSAKSIAKDWGITNEQQITAIGLAVYQMGPGGLPKFKEAKAAYQAGDIRAFQAAIRDSDWYRQTPDRVEKFLDRFLTPM